MMLPFVSERALGWQDLLPTLVLDKLPLYENIDFLSLQQRASLAVDQFLKYPKSNLLILKADDQAEYAPLLESYIESKYRKNTDAIVGVKYIVEQGDSFSFPSIYVIPAESKEDNFVAKKTVATALYFDQNQLFGSIRIHPSSKELQLNPGLVHQLNQGVLILGAGELLNQFEIWARLKQLLKTGLFDWYSLHPLKTLPCEIPSYKLDLKIIILGTRSELAALEELDETLYHTAHYGEIESFFNLETQENQTLWANYIQNIATECQCSLDLDGLNKLYQLLVRESEDRNTVSISPLRLKEILISTALLVNKPQLTDKDFEIYLQNKLLQHGFLREQTYSDILQEQVYVATEGEMVGQINGLSVIEYSGTPLSFGEPSRISCTVQFGEGEVIDVERKNELAGNIHSKGTMISETCLASILELPAQLPFSASIVFEQSYAEIDGDSASLASFCVLLSALSNLPLSQSIAITGAIDQFGLVHSVGGVNDKIEGFFTICERRGLTGKQGVIIPATVIQQISLSENVISAVKNKQFFIWTVEDVFQTCEILFNRSLVEEENRDYKEDEIPLSRLINQRIDSRTERQQSNNFWDFLFKKRE
ncbi:Lon-like ATP-dependent protease [Bisgaardia hudsonensis]|uniref:endopeptidase La n=1 Tax=Bisgaardia hudsonensis TaxID=109472 RepID=A0A4R2N1I1_9PAST|nr:Lon protease family protein [Bisgaardia hudsonensis]QLB13041.1 peptidase [Bisgaardia hudsonensis]TCP13394.1 Lon-like ATP-dependent protease [Bisgaardia hudsonensis]